VRRVANSAKTTEKGKSCTESGTWSDDEGVWLTCDGLLMTEACEWNEGHSKLRDVNDVRKMAGGVHRNLGKQLLRCCDVHRRLR